MLQIQLRIYPDTRNSELRAARQPTQYYFQPTRATLAHRSSRRLGLFVTAFVKRIPPTATVEYVGASCTFATIWPCPILL